MSTKRTRRKNEPYLLAVIIAAASKTAYVRNSSWCEMCRKSENGRPRGPGARASAVPFFQSTAFPALFDKEGDSSCQLLLRLPCISCYAVQFGAEREREPFWIGTNGRGTVSFCTRWYELYKCFFLSGVLILLVVGTPPSAFCRMKSACVSVHIPTGGHVPFFAPSPFLFPFRCLSLACAQTVFSSCPPRVVSTLSSSYLRFCSSRFRPGCHQPLLRFPPRCRRSLYLLSLSSS